MTETEVNMENKKKIDTEAIAYHMREKDLRIRQRESLKCMKKSLKE